ncbi:hypothetical protein DNTS_026278, partial [Danionella cerebrum]
ARGGIIVGNQIYVSGNERGFIRVHRPPTQARGRSRATGSDRLVWFFFTAELFATLPSTRSGSFNRPTGDTTRKQKLTPFIYYEKLKVICWAAAMHIKLILLLLSIFKNTNQCLIISEVNCDNPKLDTQEFVELYYDGTNPTSLDGYTLVFYNGNGDSAYRVIDLSGHHTDQRGFFLIGSSELNPRPAISLPPNSIQNGPDAIALYGPNWAPVSEGGLVSGVGLLDAVVYTSRKSSDGADGLASILTPGLMPFLENEAAFEGDESIQRCWESENLWTFNTGPPTPGWVNHCPAATPKLIWISEVEVNKSEKKVLVELSVGSLTGPVSLVLYDGNKGNLLRETLEFRAEVPGIFTVSMSTADLPVPESAALALYKGPSSSDLLKNGTLIPEQPIDAFVYSDLTNLPSENLTEMLIPGRKPFILTESFLSAGLHASRCGVAQWTRDPGLFVSRPKSPGKPNDCIWFQSCPLNMSFFPGSVGPRPTIDSRIDFLLNEINCDSPGGAEDEEFIELWHPSGTRMSLDLIWLVMINGQTGLVYYELELNGYYTDDKGYFLIGSSKFAPDIRIPSNTVQNGPDAVALYRSTSPPSQQGVNVPLDGLLDAVVYHTRGPEKKLWDLTEALMPGQRPLLEDTSFLVSDETLSRCRPNRLNLSTFKVASPTPRGPNNCPLAPPTGILISEWGKFPAENHSSQRIVFVELSGPPRTPLTGLLLVFFDQALPPLVPLAAILLCFEASGSGVFGPGSVHLDWLVFSHDAELQRIIQHNTTFIETPTISGGSLSRCVSDALFPWLSSQPTPGLINHCPNPSFSSTVDLCITLEDQHIIREKPASSSVVLQVGLVVSILLLFAVGAIIFFFLYKRRPADYLSMQMSEQAETPLQL